MSEINNKEATRKRLEEILKELEKLREERNSLRNKWEIEKNYIQRIRDTKEQIENSKLQADDYERNGDYAKVAEIRYGIMLELEKNLKDNNDKLAKVQQDGKMLKEEVDAEDIAEIVAKWTGIPV